MSDTVILRKIYALDSNTGLYMSSGNVLVTEINGGTSWQNLVGAISTTGGPQVAVLPSTLSTMSSATYELSYSTALFSTSIWNSFNSLSNFVYATALTGGTGGTGGTGTYDPSLLVTKDNLTSTVAGLSNYGGTGAGYITSSMMGSTLSTVLYFYPTNQELSNTINNLSNIPGLAYTTSSFVLEQVGELSTTVSSLYVTGTQLNSTINRLGNWLGGSGGYISTQNLTSTINGLGNYGYISTITLKSTIDGLGSYGYVSTQNLVSTTDALLSNINAKTNVRFDNTTTVSVYDSIVTFSNVASIVYLSSFLMSTFSVGTSSNERLADVIGGVDLRFSTLSMDLSPFSSFITDKSRVTLDIYPSIYFTKIATGTNAPAMLPISTFLRYGTTEYRQYVTTSYVPVNQGRMIVDIEPGLNISTPLITYVDSSNAWTTPIRLQIASNVINQNNYSLPYTLMHHMPGGVNNAGLQKALHSNNYTPFFASTGSVFISVQNLP